LGDAVETVKRGGRAVGGGGDWPVEKRGARPTPCGGELAGPT
jgi:hypothetical protein